MVTTAIDMASFTFEKDGVIYVMDGYFDKFGLFHAVTIKPYDFDN